jgi:hypothetical protein
MCTQDKHQTAVRTMPWCGETGRCATVLYAIVQQVGMGTRMNATVLVGYSRNLNIFIARRVYAYMIAISRHVYAILMPCHRALAISPCSTMPLLG